MQDELFVLMIVYIKKIDYWNTLNKYVHYLK